MKGSVDRLEALVYILFGLTVITLAVWTLKSITLNNKEDE